MSHSTLGILIIIAFIVIGFASGGEIFQPYNVTETNTPWQYEYKSDEERFNRDSNGYGGSNNNNRSTANSRPTDISREINRISYQVDELGRSVAEYVENQNASIYKDKIKIRGIRNPESFREYITLSSSLGSGEQVAISGWKLQSLVTGSYVIIGGAANNPIVGRKDESPIFISRNSRVIISQGNSPINTSFRVNKCSGYLEQKHNFYPAISNFNCPAPIESAPSYSRIFDNECLDYIESLPICEEPRERDIPETISLACENYVKTNINYESCVINHRNDPDFYTSEWRVYIPTRGIFWLEKRDRIQLIDNSGRVVDTIDY